MNNHAYLDGYLHKEGASFWNLQQSRFGIAGELGRRVTQPFRRDPFRGRTQGQLQRDIGESTVLGRPFPAEPYERAEPGPAEEGPVLCQGPCASELAGQGTGIPQAVAGFLSAADGPGEKTVGSVQDSHR